MEIVVEEGDVMAEHDIVILGSGSLARSVCYSLALVSPNESVVTVVSRTASSSAEVCYIADVRATLAGTAVKFRPLSLGRYSADSISSILRQTRPKLVLNCASYQSPWEKIYSPSAWTTLMSRAGFGITLPLQAAVAIEASTAVAGLDSPPLFVNACFPDAVNPLLKALGLPVFCGVGNVALLAASLRESLRPDGAGRLQVLGHHWHLHTPPTDADDALAWLDGMPIHGVGSLLRRQRATARSELNIVNGLVTALLLAGIVSGREMWTSLPGPLGLPGGYPVRVHGDVIELNLPEGISQSQALFLNSQWAERDGVYVEEDGKVTFSKQGFLQVRSELPDFASTVPATDIPGICSRLLEVRSRLRLMQAASGGNSK
ncbi:hypothetical protein [Nonomuraea sp. NPDC049400]|uniref:hypothetical protein n=1 Tax=Nonomuraea sp. NPDC049400 TaxID=3364352 RepID=UPI0037A6578D